MMYDDHHAKVGNQPRVAAKDARTSASWSVAARAIRRSGYDGTGVADIMKEAGLTHGAFYSHFASARPCWPKPRRKACAESAARRGPGRASAPPGRALASMLAAYLSEAHVEQAERGCPLAALGSKRRARSRGAAGDDASHPGE
jgi:AcrR family transcriptional regulator